MIIDMAPSEGVELVRSNLTAGLDTSGKFPYVWTVPKILCQFPRDYSLSVKQYLLRDDGIPKEILRWLCIVYPLSLGFGLKFPV